MGCSTKKNLSVWSVRLPSSFFSKFISKLFNPSKMKSNKHQRHHHHSHPDLPHDNNRKSSKLTNPPPPLLDMLSPRTPRRRRPMGLRMWTVMRLHLLP